MNIAVLNQLQNGSDIRGVALEGVPGEVVNLTAEIAEKLGRSFAAWLAKNSFGTGKVAVGTDSRISGPKLKEALIKGLTQAGMDVLDCGMASTPAMFMTTILPEYKATGSIMITASHLPFNRNGMKFFTSNGGFDSKDISRLLEFAASDGPVDSDHTGTTEKVDFISTYADFLLHTIRNGVNDPDHFEQPLKGLHIVVDAGNGAGGFFADKVLVPLGARISGSQFLEPDGTFPNHIPNPENKEAMDSICRAVVRHHADLGIIFDTDVDRAAVVDPMGNAINRNDLIALISAVILEEHPGSVVVTDSITSTGLNWFIEVHLKGIHHRFQRGYKNVINESVRLNREGQESWLAIETSGHAALKENRFLDDGAFLVAKLLIKMAKMDRKGQSLSDLITALPRPVEEQEYRLKITAGNFREYGAQVLSGIGERAKKEAGWSPENPNYEGIRINCTQPDELGWFLLRMSLHDPVMPLNIESSRSGGVRKIVHHLRKLLVEFKELDISSLHNK